MTRISENMIAPSMRPANLSMGCRVKVEAISGERQHAKKSFLPLASWYSGRYRPAIGQEGISCCVEGKWGNLNLDASPTLVVSRLSHLHRTISSAPRVVMRGCAYPMRFAEASHSGGAQIDEPLSLLFGIL